MDQELIAYLDARFNETAQQITSLREETTGQIVGLREEITSFREETTRRFEQIDSRLQKMEDTDRQTLVVIEGLRHEMHLVAEAVVGLDEKLRRYHSESTVAFDQVKGWIEPYYKDLSGRLTVMESWADRQLGDVMDAVRKLVGHPPLQRPVPSD